MKFSDVFNLKRSAGKVSLRRSQFKMAETNPTMAIWLGKQYLGQRDNMRQEVKITDDGFLAALAATAKEDWSE